MIILKTIINTNNNDGDDAEDDNTLFLQHLSKQKGYQGAS